MVFLGNTALVAVCSFISLASGDEG
ncbi:MAG: hypothetical protein RL551_1525, partial [Pseudomonadota bacterium]